jgi:hypothetical protein
MNSLASHLTSTTTGGLNKAFKWTTKSEECLLNSIMGLQPSAV